MDKGMNQWIVKDEKKNKAVRSFETEREAIRFVNQSSLDSVLAVYKKEENL